MDDDLAAYLAYRQATDWSPATVRAARSSLGRLVAFLRRQGRDTWATVTAGDLERYLLHLRALGRSRSTRDHLVWDARGLLAWLHRHGRIAIDLADQLDPPDDDDHPLPPRPLTRMQVEAIFAAIGDATPTALRDRLLVDLLYSTGLRCGEALALDVADLDLGGGLLHVAAGKTGAPRTLPVPAGLAASAEAYLAVRAEFLRGPDHGALLLGVQGGRLHPLLPGRILAALGRRLGFRLHPHALRHAIACHLHAEGVPLRAIQALLGHADLNITFGVYIRLHDQRLRADYDAAMPDLLPLPDDAPAEEPIVPPPAAS